MCYSFTVCALYYCVYSLLVWRVLGRLRSALVAVLLLLLLELPEVGLDGGGRLLHLHGAQRGGGRHVRHGTHPVAHVGVCGETQSAAVTQFKHTVSVLDLSGAGCLFFFLVSFRFVYFLSFIPFLALNFNGVVMPLTAI